MAYHYENLKLEKGMYGQGGRSFAQTLEALDPSESYKGTALEGLDAFQRQLNALFEADVVDITADIRVMEQMMASEGLAGTNDFK